MYLLQYSLIYLSRKEKNKQSAAKSNYQKKQRVLEANNKVLKLFPKDHLKVPNVTKGDNESDYGAHIEILDFQPAKDGINVGRLTK